MLLTDRDYVAIEGYPFQRWGERSGSPYRDIRPLGEAAARRVWERAMRLNGDEPEGALPRQTFPVQGSLDLPCCVRPASEEWFLRTATRRSFLEDPRRTVSRGWTS